MRHHQRRKFWLCFVDAGRGVAYMLRSERNARIHLIIVVGVLIASVCFRVTPGEWCAIFLASGLVWMAEAFNTAIERMTDLLSPEIRAAAGNAKDVAAAGVLISAVAASAVGGVIFLPYLLKAIG